MGREVPLGALLVFKSERQLLGWKLGVYGRCRGQTKCSGGDRCGRINLDRNLAIACTLVESFNKVSARVTLDWDVGSEELGSPATMRLCCFTVKRT